MIYLFEALFGFLGGIFGGMGMGGGTLLIPLLVIFLGFEQTLAQGINLLSFLVMAIISLFIHLRHGLVEFEGLWQIVVGGVVFSTIGSLLATTIDAHILKIIFGVFLCILGIYQFINVLRLKS